MYTADPLTMTSDGKTLTMKSGRTGMGYQKYIGLAALTPAGGISAYPPDATRTWKASFDTQIGEQHYTYDLKPTRTKWTGKATNDRGSTDLAEVMVKGNDKLRIECTGKVSGDEISSPEKWETSPPKSVSPSELSSHERGPILKPCARLHQVPD
jgi:hypothetical protein